MPKYEMIKVDVSVDGQQGGSLSRFLEQLCRQFEQAGKTVSNLFSAVNTQVGKSANQVLKLMDDFADGPYKVAGGGTYQRALMGFDKLNRLSKGSGGGTVFEPDPETAEKVSKLLGKIQQLNTDLKDKIFDPLVKWGSTTVGAVLSDIASKLFGCAGATEENTENLDGYTGIWDSLNVKTNFWRELIAQTEPIVGTFNQTLGIGAVNAAEVAAAIAAMDQEVDGASGGWLGLGAAAKSVWDAMSADWSESGQWFTCHVTTPVDTAFSTMLSDMKTEADTAWGATKSVFSDAGGYFSGVFSQAWKNVMGVFEEDGEVFTSLKDGVLAGFKTQVNKLIDGFNQVTAEPFNGLNTALAQLQKLQIGDMKPFASLSWRSTIPQIPHLAKGAVLPANKPFLAVVGDQHHGTNIEAPLSTITEAVSLSMEQFHAGNMAGHHATVGLLGQILEAVLGVRIGDEVIAAACDRYQRKMSVVGGF